MQTFSLKIYAKTASAEEVEKLLQESLKLLREEKSGNKKYEACTRKDGLLSIEKGKKAIVVGDLHGDLESLFTILKKSDFLRRVEREKIFLVFLGDYGDRGEETCEVWWTVLKLKTIFPERIILLRGNHEPPPGLEVFPFDLPYFLMLRYGERGKKIYQEFFPPLFDLLPHALIVKGKYLMLHGGVPDNTDTIDQIAFARKNHPATSHLEQILWNDPIEEEGSYPSPRGAGKLFGRDVSRRVLEILNVRTLIRSHQPCEGVLPLHQGKVLTLFSRKGPPYYNKRAAFLDIDLDAPAKDAKELAREACFLKNGSTKLPYRN